LTQSRRGAELFFDKKSSASFASLRQATEDIIQMKTELKDRCSRIEEAYEFMLAYAAQGLRIEPGSGMGSQIRSMLITCEKSLNGLADVFTQIVRADNLQPTSAYENFITVLAAMPKTPEPRCSSSWRSRRSARRWSTISTRRSTCARCSPIYF
jgi:hypothetical protein